MPGARGHDIITVISAVGLAPLVQSIQAYNGIGEETATRNTAIVVVAHLLSGMLFSPDLDLDSAIDDRWGPLYILWRPYMHIIPHRHFFSHSLIVSPLLRLLYFYLMIVAVLVGGAWLLGRAGVVVPYYHVVMTDRLLGLIRDYPQETRSFLLGFITGSAAHTMADYFVTDGKLLLRRVGIRVRGDYRNHDVWRPRARSRQRRSWGRW